jgi:hypothetical protein
VMPRDSSALDPRSLKREAGRGGTLHRHGRTFSHKNTPTNLEGIGKGRYHDAGAPTHRTDSAIVTR